MATISKPVIVNTLLDFYRRQITADNLGYRRRIYRLCQTLLEPYMPFATACDFGSGNGWFAQKFQQNGVANRVVAVDVHRQENCYIEPLLYSGRRLPFDDRSFELTYSIDVLHHCPDPVASLKEILRCTDQYLVIKDHTYQTFPGWLTLCFLDEIGNRPFGIKTPYKFQKGWQWFSCLEDAGFSLDHLIHPAYCHPKPMRWGTSRLQFIALWKRETG
ncbi:MAG: class I SAM-dependent methyltransferase [Anaerolineaceae bacterium]|nr:class I SAM-dependent methyltransferase [Anaerolineaceae bacterium]MCB9101802.1 class I SAM-dependent methyltransferase [Anaerolineales bacterium]